MKLKINSVKELHNVTHGATKVLWGFLYVMGQQRELKLCKRKKEIIQELIGVSITSQELYLTELVKAGILIRPSRGLYELNNSILEN